MTRGREGRSARRTTGPADRGYQIGTVARMTGVDEYTLRAWETRHGAVRPARSRGGTRLYGDADVSRLRLLRALTGCGEPIGRIAGMPDAALRDRLARVAGWSGASALLRVRGRPLRIAAVGASVVRTLSTGRRRRDGLETVLAEETLPIAVDRIGAAAPDALIVHLDALGRDPAVAVRRLLERCEARVTAVVYEFARRADLSTLSDQGIHLVHGPIRRAQLEQVLLDLAAAGPLPARDPRDDPEIENDLARGAPERIFDDAQIARLREISSSIDCECPNHLSALIESLVAFERYARACESRSPADARLHERLARGTARARRRMESLLQAVCEHDGIEL